MTVEEEAKSAKQSPEKAVTRDCAYLQVIRLEVLHLILPSQASDYTDDLLLCPLGHERLLKKVKTEMHMKVECRNTTLRKDKWFC